MSQTKAQLLDGKSATIQFTGGSASAPSVSFTGDTNTGIYSPGADQVAISTGGSGRLFIGSTGAVGVGASNPGYALDVAAADTTAGLGYALRLRANSTAGAAAIQFTNNPVSAEYSVIAGDSSSNLKFLTSGSERLRIASDGQVSIGTSAAKAPLHLFGAGQATASIADAGARGCFLRLSDNSAAAGAGGAILFANVQGDSANSLGFAAIKGLLIDGANNTRGDISFSTRANNTDSSLTERMRIGADGAVGIGRVPAYTLDVAGGARFGATTGEVNLELGTGATGNRAVYIDFVGDTTYTDYAFRIIRLDTGANAASQFEHRGTGDFALNTIDAAPLILRTNNSERLRITSAGNVGIGTTSPTAKLTVFENTGTGAINLSDFSAPAANQNPLIRLISRNAANTTTTSVDLYKVYQSGFSIINNDTDVSNFTSFNVGSSERLRITSAGLVGIGTSSPAKLLEVNEGDIQIRNSSTASINTLLNYGLAFRSTNQIGQDRGTIAEIKPYLGGAGDNDFGLQFRTQATTGGGVTTKMALTPGGSLGIGTTSPTVKLTARDSNESGIVSVAAIENYITTNPSSGNGVALDFNLNNNGNATVNRGQIAVVNTNFHAESEMRFYTATSNAIQQRMVIDSSGRVGIGTTSPGAALNIGADGDFWLASSVNNVEEKNLISWRIEDGSEGARISAFREAVSNAPHSILFSTRTTGGALTEKARIDSSGRLLVGTSSTSANARVLLQGSSGNNNANLWLARSNSPGTGPSDKQLGAVLFCADNHVFSALIEAQRDGGTWTAGSSQPTLLAFSTTADGASSPTERLRITSAGKILYNTATAAANTAITITAFDNSVGGAAVELNGWGNGRGHAINFTAHNTASADVVYFNTSAATVGSISITSTATAYNTSSDYRLKENIVPVIDGIIRLQQLKPSRFNFLADPSKVVDGFIAHEVQSVVPEAVTGTKDEISPDGTPKYQGIDQSKLVPLLTAALQEAIGEIESLKARVAALESA